MAYNSSVQWSDHGDKLLRIIARNFQWKIENFSSLPQDADAFYESPEFSSLGFVWRLKFFPNGESFHSSQGWIGLYLEMYNSDLRNVDFIIGIEDKTGVVKFQKGLRSEFLKRYVGKGWMKFLKRDELISQKSELYPSDTLIITFSIIDKQETGLKPPQASKKIGSIAIGDLSVTSDLKGLITLRDNLREAFLSGEGSDVNVIVRKKTFKAHKAILKLRSKVLSSMLTQDIVDIKIDDCEPEAFGIFLLYLYIGKVEYFTDKNMLDMYHIVDKYDDTGLKSECVSFIVHNMSKENRSSIESIAKKHNDNELLDCIEHFFKPVDAYSYALPYYSYELHNLYDEHICSSILK